MCRASRPPRCNCWGSRSRSRIRGRSSSATARYSSSRFIGSRADRRSRRSNYGTSVVYFHHLFPNARITAIEADPEIYKLLVANCGHTNAEMLQRAVSHSREPVRFFREGSDGGRAASEFSGTLGVVEVATVTLDDLIDGPVDFLKIDIEGSEGDALEACTRLALVEQMFIEYHSFKNSPQTLGRMLNKLTSEGFRYYIHHQFCSPTPLTLETLQLGMDLQLNIFAMKRPAQA